MVLKSSDSHTTNRSFILPLVGQVTFNESNEIEVEDNIGKSLLERDFGFNLIEVNTEKAKSALEELSTEDLKELIKEYPNSIKKKYQQGIN